MKRLLVSIFATALTAAFVAPAVAGDVTFSGQYRLRGEYRAAPQLNEDAKAAANYGQRVRLTANAKATDDVSAKITLQDTRVWGNTDALASDNGTDEVDLHEAYVQVNSLEGTGFNLRAGRQELAYGDERIIGAVNWSNNGQAFDALKLATSNDTYSLDVFIAKVAEGTASTAHNAAGSGADTDLWGAYASIKTIPNVALDVYGLYGHGSVGGVYGSLYTLGARVKGAVAGVDYTVELPFQTGTDDTTENDIGGYALFAKVGYTIPSNPLKIRIGAEVDYGTGDDDATDDSTDTFINLYGTNHMHFGIGDVVNSAANLTAFSVGVSLEPTEKLKLSGAFWNYSETENQDGNDEDAIGSAIDVIANYKVNNAVSAELGLSQFMAGDDLGSNADDQTWVYAMLTANF